MRGFTYILVYTAIAMTFFGCRGKPTEEVHEEHFPPHWPKTIFVASERLNSLLKAEAVESLNAGITLEQEWFDLVKWLPELAADSDLSEQEFNEIDRASEELQSIWRSSRTLPTLNEIQSASEVEPLLRRLSDICAAEKERLNKAKTGLEDE
jgi:hypothetical protein